MVGEDRRAAMPGSLSAWQAARQINKAIPAETSRIVLFMELSLATPGVMGGIQLAGNWGGFTYMMCEKRSFSHII
jgi:hypothetical protein